MKISAKFRASRRLRFEDTKRIMSPEIRPKSFGTFEKQAPVFRKSRELFGPETACFEKLIFQHVFNVRKTRRTAKFDSLEPWRFEIIKGIVVPEIGLKSFGTFEKQAPNLATC